MKPEQLTALRSLADEGYALAIFTPEELKGAPTEEIESLMIERGHDAIQDLQTEENV